MTAETVRRSKTDRVDDGFIADPEQGASSRTYCELRGALFTGGYLALGGAETTLNLDEKFQRVTIGKAVFYQVN